MKVFVTIASILSVAVNSGLTLMFISMAFSTDNAVLVREDILYSIWFGFSAILTWILAYNNDYLMN